MSAQNTEQVKAVLETVLHGLSVGEDIVAYKEKVKAEIKQQMEDNLRVSIENVIRLISDHVNGQRPGRYIDFEAVVSKIHMMIANRIGDL